MLTLEPSFGLRTEQGVARVIGLTQIPYGVALLLMQTTGYLRLSAAGVSDSACLASAGALTAVSTALFSLARVPWHLYALYTLNGLGIGLTFGAYINVPNEYVARFFPHAIAQARAVPFPFFNIGNLLGPLLLPILGEASHRTGWAAAGGLHLLATVMVLLVVRRISVATSAPPKRLAEKLWQLAERRMRGPLAMLVLAAQAPGPEGGGAVTVGIL